MVWFFGTQFKMLLNKSTVGAWNSRPKNLRFLKSFYVVRKPSPVPVCSPCTLLVVVSVGLQHENT